MRWPRDKIIVICGPTASGKSALALAAAMAVDGVIINADSVQVYQEIPILAAAPTVADLAQAPHALYSFLPYDRQLSVGKWLALAIEQINICRNGKQTPIIVGGTGMYLNSLIYGLNVIPAVTPAVRSQVQDLSQILNNQQLYAHLQLCDPQIAERLHTNDRQRIIRAIEVFYQCGKPLSQLQSAAAKPVFARHEFFVVHVNPARQLLYENCNNRFISMMDAGALNEVNALMAKYPHHQYNKGIGVKELAAAAQHAMPLLDAINKAQQATRNYAKRQMTWFRHQLDYDEVNSK